MQFCSAPFLFLLITGKLTYPNNLELGRTGSKESHCWIRKPLHCPSTVNWARSKNPTAESEPLNCPSTVHWEISPKKKVLREQDVWRHSFFSNSSCSCVREHCHSVVKPAVEARAGLYSLFYSLQGVILADHHNGNWFNSTIFSMSYISIFKQNRTWIFLRQWNEQSSCSCI